MKSTFPIHSIVNALITKDTVLLFDMDGTLVDTDYANYLAYMDAIENVTSLKMPIPYRHEMRFNRELIKRQLYDYTKIEFEQVIKQKEMAYLKYINQTKLIGQIADILKAYFATNQTVLVTNSFQSRAFTTLAYHGILNYFHDTICKTHSFSEKNKYEYAVKYLNIHPSKVIAFENEMIEIEKAILAGIPSTNIFNPTNYIKSTYDTIYN